MNDTKGLPKELQDMIIEDNKKSHPAVRLLKGAMLLLVIALAAYAVWLSVMYSRYVSVEDGVRVIDLTGTQVSSGDILRLQERFPDSRVLYNVELGGIRVRCDAESLTLTDTHGVSAPRLIEAAQQLPAVTALDLTGMTLSAGEYEAVREAYPRAKVQWTIPAAGGLSSDVIALQVKDMDTLRQVLAHMKYLPALRQLDMVGVSLSPADAAEIHTAEEQYGVKIIWSVTVAGKAMPYNTTSITLSGAGITDLSELQQLPMLAEVTLDGVGVTDLTPLAAISTLESITLKNMKVDGIAVLGTMPRLGSFFVKNTNVTYAQLNDLQRRLPECIIMMIE